MAGEEQTILMRDCIVYREDFGRVPLMYPEGTHATLRRTGGGVRVTGRCEGPLLVEGFHGFFVSAVHLPEGWEPAPALYIGQYEWSFPIVDASTAGQTVRVQLSGRSIRFTHYLNPIPAPPASPIAPVSIFNWVWIVDFSYPLAKGPWVRAQPGAGGVYKRGHIIGGGRAPVGQSSDAYGVSDDPKRVLSQDEIEAMARAKGFPNPRLASAVAMAESRGNPLAVNASNTDGSIDRGLFQINSVHSQYDAQSLFNAAYNMDAAWNISSSGTNWTPWVAFNNGNYLQFM